MDFGKEELEREFEVNSRKQKKLQNEPENSSDSQLIEEQSGLIQELQRQISELPQQTQR